MACVIPAGWFQNVQRGGEAELALILTICGNVTGGGLFRGGEKE